MPFSSKIDWVCGQLGESQRYVIVLSLVSFPRLSLISASEVSEEVVLQLSQKLL